jgi:hypothetical protein
MSKLSRLEQIINLRLNNYEISKPRKKLEIEPNPCWDGYEPIGLKDDGSPNCVPIKEEQSKVKKEGFPIPSPSSDEDEQKYISRCISEIIGEYDQEGQAYAICKAEWDK